MLKQEPAYAAAPTCLTPGCAAAVLLLLCLCVQIQTLESLAGQVAQAAVEGQEEEDITGMCVCLGGRGDLQHFLLCAHTPCVTAFLATATTSFASRSSQNVHLPPPRSTTHPCR